MSEHLWFLVKDEQGAISHRSLCGIEQAPDPDHALLDGVATEAQVPECEQCSWCARMERGIQIYCAADLDESSPLIVLIIQALIGGARYRKYSTGWPLAALSSPSGESGAILVDGKHAVIACASSKEALREMIKPAAQPET